MINERVTETVATGNLAVVDFETRKVRTPEGFRMDNGEALKSRWQIFAAGVAVAGRIHLIWGDDETALLARIGQLIKDAESVAYYATREFDEMIARGRFTNARRAHLRRPTFPAVPGAEEANWVNLRKSGATMPVRPGEQISSRDVPAAWKSGRCEAVLDHLLWDVESLVALVAEKS